MLLLVLLSDESSCFREKSATNRAETDIGKTKPTSWGLARNASCEWGHKIQNMDHISADLNQVNHRAKTCLSFWCDTKQQWNSVWNGFFCLLFITSAVKVCSQMVSWNPERTLIELSEIIQCTSQLIKCQDGHHT